MAQRYQIQNCYQDSSWEDSGVQVGTLASAIRKAREMRGEPIVYGMVRIIDLATGREVDEERATSFVDFIRRGFDSAN